MAGIANMIVASYLYGRFPISDYIILSYIIWYSYYYDPLSHQFSVNFWNWLYFSVQFRYCRVLGGWMRFLLAPSERLVQPVPPRNTLCYCAGASYRKSCISRIVGSGCDSGFGLFLHIFFCCRCSAFVGRGKRRIQGKVLCSGLPHKTLQWRPVKGSRSWRRGSLSLPSRMHTCTNTIRDSVCWFNLFAYIQLTSLRLR